ncbi:hypothetical protein WHR41_04278 [Cladosporium halotolerans]|uniref:SPIN90/Ldb17 leucine-rich domain-containing protein n=1 Tax=Cladosporium halotolerans TaxID=1052096 RepID=A0AB34KV42_9PEZI
MSAEEAEEASRALESEQAFWDELDTIVTPEFETSEDIDDVLRAFLELATNHKDEYLLSEYDFARYVYKLLDSKLFATNREYVRRQILYCLLQDDDVDTLHLAAAIFLFDGRGNESAFEMMQDEGAFARLVELISDRRDDAVGLYRMLLELLFEMARIQKLTREDMVVVDDTFILYLFQMIEQLSDDADDPYHYPIIRVLLVLNEQYMCLANAPTSPDTEKPLTNRILKILSMHGPSYRTFGENLILLLNRESSLGPQLLILKLLYLLFTTPATYEYFYTNDLHVLVDVIIRNLLDLDPGSGDLGKTADGAERDGQRALRHTYLRVLCPLLKNTQLGREGNNYKRNEVRRLLYLLVHRSGAHFAPVDETVIRLVIRCKQVEWIREEGDEKDREIEQKLQQVAPDESAVAKKLLGMSIDDGGESSLSVDEVSAKVVAKEKPTVPAPRRRKNKAKESNGAHAAGGELKVPPARAQVVDSPDEGGRSPFADDMAEEV